MKIPFAVDTGRFILLGVLFLLLAGVIVLTYIYPGENDVAGQQEDYEQDILEQWREETRNLLKNQRWSDARLSANRILLNFPGDIFAGRALARAVMELKDVSLAERLCRQQISATADDAIARNNLAVLLAFDYPNAAAQEIAVALRLQPEHPAIKYNHNVISALKQKHTVPVGSPPDTADPEIFIITLPKEKSAL